MVVCGKPTAVIVVPSLNTDGLAVWNTDYGVILLRRYPKCLKHEQKHICEGHWHDVTKRNGEYCDEL